MMQVQVFKKYIRIDFIALMLQWTGFYMIGISVMKDLNP